MKDKYMALLLIVVSSFMLFLSPLGSLSTTLAQQERVPEQSVDSTNKEVDRPLDKLIGGSPCGRPTVEEAVKQEVEESLKRFRQDNVEAYNAPGSVTISVYFHVINQGAGIANGDVPESILDQQISVLNLSFAFTQFFFQKACVNRITRPEWYRMRIDSAVERQAKTVLRRGGATDLNFYTIGDNNRTNEIYPHAFSRFPWTYVTETALDGVVVPHTFLPGGGRAPFDQGDIAVHEVGHWLGLYHTWEGGCSIQNDRVSDTPAHTEPPSVVGTCPSGPVPRDSCPQPGVDPDDNFMTDTSDFCKRKFTPGQTVRMNTMYTQYREGNSCGSPVQCGVSTTASIAWIMPSENTWGPPNTMTVAGYAQNGCRNVQLVWRDTTIGGNWNVVTYQAIPALDGTWSNTIPSPYKCHNFEAYVNYSGITSPTFPYNGSNAGFCNESVNLIWIQPAGSNLRVAGSAFNAPSGTQVFVWYRNLTTGAGWVRHHSSAGTLPDGIWLLDIPNTNFFHMYEVQAEYDVVFSAPCTYRGNNTIWWCQ